MQILLHLLYTITNLVAPLSILLFSLLSPLAVTGRAAWCWCWVCQLFVPWPPALWTDLSAKALPVRGQRRWDTEPADVLFMRRPCWVGSYSASESQMWFNLCSIHCHDCWPLITGKVRGCWISAGALCYRAQSASLIAQRSITRHWKWARVRLLEVIGQVEKRHIYNIY